MNLITRRPLSVKNILRVLVLLAVFGPPCLCRGDEPVAVDPKTLIPWKSLDEKTRAKVEAIVNEATIHHRAPAEVFVCGPELYQLYLNEPVLTLELWKGLATSDATLEETSPDHYRGTDGLYSHGQWEFIYKSPELNVLLAEGQYRGPLLGTTLHTKSVLVLRTVYFQERDGRKFVKHQLDGWVKADSGTLKPLAKALRPVFQRSVEATMQESLWFVSLMCRYTAHDPHAVARTLESSDRFPQAAKLRLQKLIAPLLASVPERKQLAARPDTER